jgi:murein L,D-transpeptidase YcbB/YkuD
MFPNRFSVYLHDTNSRGYFSRENRSLSSGCVRVQDPFILTEHLIDDSEKWPQDSIKKVIEREKTLNVTFKKDIYLHLLYWTAWSDGNTLKFRTDIYNLDANLYKKLRN